MKILLSLLTLALVACDKPKSSISAGGGTLESYPLDGHLFVVYEGHSKGGVIHHPGCPCLRTKPTAPTP